MNQKEELPPLKYIIQTLFYNNANYILSAIPIVNIQNNQYSNFEYQIHSALNVSTSTSTSRLPFIIINSPRSSGNNVTTTSSGNSISTSTSIIPSSEDSTSIIPSSEDSASIIPSSEDSTSIIPSPEDSTSTTLDDNNSRMCVKCRVTKSYTWRRSKEIKEPNSKKGARVCNRCGLAEIKKRKELNQIMKS